MFFPLYREYNENPFAVLECPEFTQRLYDVTDYHSAIVTIDDTTKYFWVSSKNGSSYREIDGQGLPTPELIDAASMTGWRIPDVSDESFYIYFDGGTRIKFKHYQYNGANRVVVEPVFGIRHIEEYVDGSFGYQTPLFNYGYDPTDVGSITLHVFHCTVYGFRNFDGWAGNYRPAYVFFIRIRSKSGSLGDPIYMCAFEDELLTLSDGEQKAPNAPNKTTRRGGMGTGSYPGRVNGDPLTDEKVQLLNAYTSYGSANGIGLTFYQMAMEDFKDVVKFAYQLGIVKDNSYIRDCLVSAYKLPIVDVTATPSGTLKLADRNIPGLTTNKILLEHITYPKECVYNFTNNEHFSVGWDNYTDFTNTKLTLYLPFVGSINIDVNACQYSTLKVKYIIDCYTGNIVYWIYTQSVDSDTNTLYGVYSGNCAISIPLMSAGQSGSVLGKITNVVSSLATGTIGLAAGSPRLAINGLSGSLQAINDVAFPAYSVNRGGSIDVNSNVMQSLTIRLKISKPRVLRCDSVHLIGLPSYFKAKISELPSGYHVVGAVDVDTISNATTAEKEEIKRILMGGFYK